MHPSSRGTSTRAALTSGMLLLALATLGCASGGGSNACTLIGCVDGFELQLSPNAAWPAGDYRFEFETGGAKQICTGRVPFPPCATRALTCVGGPIATVSESGCALAAPQHGFASIRFSGKPARVHVLVQRDAATILDRELVPAYVTSRPNGPNCEPVCTSASDTANVTF